MSFSKNRVIFRADGNGQIGLGHIMRCIALSEMLKEDFIFAFAVTLPDASLKIIIETFGELIVLTSSCKTEELSELDQFLSDSDIFVADGYHFDLDYQKHIKSIVYKMVMIDDLADADFCADLVINHGNDAVIDKYKRETHVKILTGFKYLIVRLDFLNAAKKIKNISQIKTAFICMGGADPYNTTMKVLKGCIQSGLFKDIIVIIGAAYSYLEDLNMLIESYQNGTNIKLLQNINSKEMIKYISISDLCICPSSSISLEVCCVTSGLLTGMTAENQSGIHDQLIKDNCCISLGNFNTIEVGEIAAVINRMSKVNIISEIMKNQRLVIDGKSNERILNQFKLLSRC
ncbi:UDP-2,4-diacetamido-2,4,6-trideoxy-beta-L-altropyranose hydrolase [Pedobacter cryoconitis]|uniref:UDP-2,4-diacetamido-2,4, 6-trideoxy-beta-L-altropyranose hydrolase n=1 Tax=Pedobacter cryoconitis TaxID=188932 RepID=A0A327SVR5_9SPHI|nr:UDP-2,4-diacetamido-2,4,6-trideoxy-beta-L-altropyranose hydrolase [Pedobacter cryoconitis]RAJ33476.1 UDP-2,4-diacetamido-2,4,6-trideoxy-beta-L-altropyranose hydrolase [Pedobacter cryoconitis]